MIFPDAITKDAAKAEMITFNPEILFGRQMIAATITEAKVIKKFKGRMSNMIVVILCVKSDESFDERFIVTYKKKRNTSHKKFSLIKLL